MKDRLKLINFLTNHKIGSRLLFAGNLTKQPYFNKINYRIYGKLENTDSIMKNVFWIGLQPSLNDKQKNYLLQSINYLFNK